MSTYHLTPHESVTLIDHSPERLLVDVRYEPDGSAPPAHFHPGQDETFEVVSGTIGVRLNGKTRVLIGGDVLEIPRGTPHSMWNAGSEPARGALGDRAGTAGRSSGSGCSTATTASTAGSRG